MYNEQKIDKQIQLATFRNRLDNFLKNHSEYNNDTVKNFFNELETDFNKNDSFNIDLKYKIYRIFTNAFYDLSRADGGLHNIINKYLKDIEEVLSNIDKDYITKYFLRKDVVHHILRNMATSNSSCLIEVDFANNPLLTTKFETGLFVPFYFRLFGIRDILLYSDRLPINDSSKIRLNQDLVLNDVIVESALNNIFKEANKLFSIESKYVLETSSYNIDHYNIPSEKISEVFVETIEENYTEYLKTIDKLVRDELLEDYMKYLNILISILSAEFKDTPKYVYKKTLVNAISYKTFQRILNTIGLDDVDIILIQLKLILKYSNDVVIESLIKPKDMEFESLLKFDKLLYLVSSIKLHYNFINYSDFSIHDYNLYDENIIETIYLIIKNKYPERYSDYIDFKNTNYYQKIAMCPINLQWKFLLKENPPQNLESFSPLYFGGKKGFEKFSRIHKELNAFTDFYDREKLMIASVATVLDDDLLKASQSLFVASNVAEIMNSLSASFKFPSKDNIRIFKQKMKIISQFIRKFKIQNFNDTISFEGILHFYDDYNRLPNSIGEFTKYLFVSKYHNVPEELAIHLFKLGVTNFQEYLEVWNDHISNQEFDDIIPDVTVTENGYTFRKVSKKDPLCLFLGNYTKCCQTLNSAARSCVLYGLENENSGFYAIEKDGEILFQSWVWVQDNVLVFDSIEGSMRDLNDDVIKLIQKSFDKILEESNIIEIRIGDTDFGITEEIIEKIPVVECDAIMLEDYSGYTDANKQVQYQTLKVEYSANFNN